MNENLGRESQKKTSPLKGRYLIQKVWVNKLFTWLDFILSYFPKGKKKEIPSDPKLILVSHLAHLGDVVMMTALLSALKAKFPQSQIGVVIGSWALPVVQNHPHVDYVHIVDHWKLNRAPISLLQKTIRYYKTKKKALQEIRQLNYEIALDAYYYFPNAIPYFWQASIPTRIGYTSGGFGPLLTHALEWKDLNQPVIYYYAALLEFLGVSKVEALSLLKPCLVASAQPSKISKNYIVLHPGTGSKLKEWPLEKWCELVNHLKGYQLVFTGKGREEKEKIQQIIGKRAGCLNLADQLTWQEYLEVLGNAALLIGVDSLAGHCASALNTPAVLIYSGITNTREWAPTGKECSTLTHPVFCSPCYKSAGCSTMACVRNVTVEEVLKKCENILTGLKQFKN